ncbi:MAG: hypothetical protein AAGH40_06390 [Verrucomicrobiota bacterium]
MTTEHGYALDKPAITLATAICVIIFFELTEENTHWLVYAVALAPTLLGAIFMVAKVRVNQEGIRIDYALPFQKERFFRHEEIESYGAMKGTNGKAKASFGFLKARGEKNAIALSALGTKDFPELSDFLESIYPTVNESHNQLGDDKSE